MLVSSSDGFWRDGLVGAILLRALMVAVVVVRSREVETVLRNIFVREIL